MGIDGVGRMTALSISKACPEKDTASPRKQPLNDRQGFVGANAPPPGTDPAHGKLVRVFTADADPKRKPSGRNPRHRRQLPGHRQRVPQGQ